MLKTMNDHGDSGDALVDKAALSNALPKSSAESVIAARLSHQWPRDCLELAGQFPDFPLSKENLVTQLAEVPRTL
ncbi:hypothetical protein B9Z51_13165 [Limnohabitans sp. T6-5]|uniref:CopG family transcriptional regulator n=1 Tax=Limnohabitans sp. T6-5 TaxID=1100724 RepID=UPI000D3B0BAB|nr:CopG family transcriptional regulator [Limnohabitans sp. T6-5]PUE06871.1 hypothetical protein B9Z51_13165 [Limnohabitans sp. T6-5]